MCYSVHMCVCMYHICMALFHMNLSDLLICGDIFVFGERKFHCGGNTMVNGSDTIRTLQMLLVMMLLYSFYWKINCTKIVLVETLPWNVCVHSPLWLQWPWVMERSSITSCSLKCAPVIWILMLGLGVKPTQKNNVLSKVGGMPSALNSPRSFR